MPKRIQRKCTKDWHKPEGAVYVGRGTKWGNPFIQGSAFYGISASGQEGMKEINTLEEAAQLFDDVLDRRWFPFRTSVPSVEDVRRELAGKDLMCWCSIDQPCHADVLLAIANREGEQ